MSMSLINEVVFQHLIELPNCDCTFCSTREASTGKTRLYLIFKDQKRIYKRNGLHGTWDEIKDKDIFAGIQRCFEEAVWGGKVPRFVA